MSSPERGIWLQDATHREDLATFVERAVRLDDAAVIRLRERSGGLVVAWVATGFDVLASRVVAGRMRPADLSAGVSAPPKKVMPIPTSPWSVPSSRVTNSRVSVGAGSPTTRGLPAGVRSTWVWT